MYKRQVVRVNSKVGQFADKVEDDKPMFSIENLEQLELELKVSEFSVGKVKIGQKAVISADILGSETEEGQVVKISPTGEEKGGGSTERVVPATIRIEGENTRLIAGINARAQLMIDEAEDAFVVPSSALAEGENGTCIAEMCIRDSLNIGSKSLDAKLKTDLIISLTSCAMADSYSAFLAGNVYQTFCNSRTCHRGS